MAASRFEFFGITRDNLDEYIFGINENIREMTDALLFWQARQEKINGEDRPFTAPEVFGEVALRIANLGTAIEAQKLRVAALEDIKAGRTITDEQNDLLKVLIQSRNASKTSERSHSDEGRLPYGAAPTQSTNDNQGTKSKSNVSALVFHGTFGSQAHYDFYRKKQEEGALTSEEYFEIFHPADGVFSWDNVQEWGPYSNVTPW